MTPAEVRALYPVLKTRAYLNAGTNGPLAARTVETFQRALTQDLASGRSGAERWERYRSLYEGIIATLARVIGVQSANLVPTTSTTEGCGIAIAAMRLRAEDEVVTTDNEHPGLTGPLAISGATIRVAEVLHHPAAEAMDRILALVTPRTRLIALSHACWMNGQRLPVHEIKRATGLPVLVDGAQSGGAINVDAAELDFYTVSCQKWMCGPEGTGALYVKEPDNYKPAIGGAFAERASGAQRFQANHHSLPTLEAWAAALELHPDWRYDRAASIATLARERLSERYEMATEAGQSTLVSFVPVGDPPSVVGRLAERDVVVRDLPGTPWVRISCGYWNDESDIDRLIDGLAV